MNLFKKDSEYKGMNPILLTVISGYLIYLGISILREYKKLGDDRTLLTIGALVFIAVGVLSLYRAVMLDKKYHNGLLTRFGVFTIPEEEYEEQPEAEQTDDDSEAADTQTVDPQAAGDPAASEERAD